MTRLLIWMYLATVFVSPDMKSSLCEVSRHDEYLAAVVQYSPVKTDALNVTMLENAVAYEQIIQRVQRYKADIIVFPETGLTGFGYSQNRTEIRPYLIEIPNPKDRVIPYLHGKYNHPILEKLSYAAKENEMYVVVNLLEIDYCTISNGSTCPNDGAYYYNTNVVFNREGAIVARYRKINLFCEPGFNYPQSTELSIFETDFGVTFGMFICFDIMFSQPSIETIRQNGITDIIYTTAWLSEYPLLTAVEIQSGWSYATNVNLLAANLNNPSLWMGGSGIYGGTLGPLIVYGSTKGNGSKILMTKVPKNSGRLRQFVVSSTKDEVAAYLHGSDDDIANETLLTDHRKATTTANTYLLDPSFGDAKKKILKLNNNNNNSEDNRTSYANFSYQGNGLDCNVEVVYEIDDNSLGGVVDNVHYKLYGYAGGRSFTCTVNTVEMCGLSLCSDSHDHRRHLCVYPEALTATNTTILSIKIRANSMNVKSVPIPITLNTDLRPLYANNFEFSSQLINVNGTDLYVSQLELLEPVSNLLTIGIYKLPFERNVKESSSMVY